MMAVLVGAIASMVIGSLWYGPFFGKQWAKLSGVSMEKMSGKTKGMGKAYALMFIGAFIMCSALAHNLIFGSAYLNASGVSAGLMAGFWNWLGFIAPVTMGVVLWERKSWKLWCINNTYWLLTLCVMGTILAVWG